MTSALVVNGTIRVHGNTLENLGPTFDSAAHNNAILLNGSRDVKVSDNIIRNLSDGAQSIFTGINYGYTAYVFNNVISNISTQQPSASQSVANNGCSVDERDLCLTAGTVYFYNNTIESGPDSNPTLAGFSINPAVTAVYIDNNHIITSATTPNSGIWSSSGSPTVNVGGNNLVQNRTTANSQGYTSAQTYPFSPTDSGDSTVGAGADLSGSCADCANSSKVGVLYDNVSNTVTSPYLTVLARGTWDIGAYQFADNAGFIGSGAALIVGVGANITVN